jgi:hypothetical protein
MTFLLPKHLVSKHQHCADDRQQDQYRQEILINEIHLICSPLVVRCTLALADAASNGDQRTTNSQVSNRNR